MQKAGLTEADLQALTKDQLVKMVAARGEALVVFVSADNAISDKIFAGTLQAGDMQQADSAKQAALVKLGEIETAILFGSAGGARPN